MQLKECSLIVHVDRRVTVVSPENVESVALAPYEIN